MTSKALLNNMQMYKKRDALADHQVMHNRFMSCSGKQDKLTLPQLKMGAKNTI